MSDRTRVPVDLNEATISHAAPIPAGVTDLETTALIQGVKHAREEAEKLIELQRTMKADPTMSPESAALRVRTQAIRSAEAVARRLDAARAQVVGAIDMYDRSTAAPDAPRDAAALSLETEIRAGLKAMTERDRKDAVAAAFTNKNLAVIGAVLRGPAFLSGLSDAELAIQRHRYQIEFHHNATVTANRRRKGLAAFDRLGESFVRLVGQLTEDPLALKAEAAQTQREAAEAALKGEQ